MTDQHATLDREPVEHWETLWVTDAELIRRLGSPRDLTRAIIHAYDRNPSSGFPKKIKLWGDRRYWPAVKAFFDAQNGLKIDASQGRRQ